MSDVKPKPKLPERHEFDFRRNSDQESISKQTHYEDIYPTQSPDESQKAVSGVPEMQ